MPIDYIAATSMGAIVGGLYASGMAPDADGEAARRGELADAPVRQPAAADVGLRRKDEQAAFPLAFEIGYRDGEFLWFKGALSGATSSSSCTS